MKSTVQYSKGLLVLLICQLWLSSVQSNSSSTVETSSSQSPTTPMTTSSVSMTTDSTVSTKAVSPATTAATTPMSTAVMTTMAAASTSVPAASSASASTSAPTSASISAPTSASSAMAYSSTMTTYNTTMNSVNGTSSPVNCSSCTISCRNFTCNGTNCYEMFMSMNASMCPSTSNYCELRRRNDSMYSVACADTCDLDSTRCVNSSQVDCVKNCCNTTDCLNVTLSSMETQVTTVTTATKTTTTTTTTTTAKPNNGKKCKKISCKGSDCYMKAQAEMGWCYDQQNYCQLKKMKEGSDIMWMAGCTNNCTKEIACTATAETCHQECCVASAQGDCLKLDGKVNMPNSNASRALYSSIMLLATSIMVWLFTGTPLL